MPCPICQKRPPKRFCPAKADNICAVCCGTEREVTIDCPFDCNYLVTSRKYEQERREIDWSNLPFADIKVDPSFAREHGPLLMAISYAICSYARDNRSLVDSDVLAALRALAEAYRTLTSGIYYENPPDYRPQRELYAALKVALDDYKKARAGEVGGLTVRDADIRDALIFFTQLAATRTNGRPKGRAFLDLLRTQFKPETFSRPASDIILLP